MSYLKLFSVFILTIFLSSILMTISCSNKDRHGCFDPKLYKMHKDDFCTADCPGVTGCDGNFYCNECEANRKGISIR